MPVKFPCTTCKKACKECKEEGDESICCDRCLNWVHFRCTNESRETLTNPDFSYICDRCYRTCPVCDKLCRKNQKFIPCNSCKFQHHEKCIFVNIPGQQTFFNCQTCNSSSAEPSLDDTNQNIFVSSDLNNTETSFDSISLNNSDFEFESDNEDYDSRGLNFNVLPFVGNLATKKQGNPNLFNNCFSKRTRVYKFPCLVCHSVCSKNQNCICCTLCDEWVHLKCTDLTVAKFNKYTDKDNSEPYYCVNCLYGNEGGRRPEPPDHTSHFVINSRLEIFRFN